MTVTLQAPSGLEGLVVATTAIGDVRGDEGWFHYRGFDATELARRCTLEQVWHLLAVGHLPDADELRRFTQRVVAARRSVPADELSHLASETSGTDRMATLRTAWSSAAASLGCRPWGDLDEAARLEQAVALSAVGPLLVAAVHPDGIAVDPGGLPDGSAAALLTLVQGRDPTPVQAAALERYLVLTLDHGLNASTFTARTVASTGADLGAVLVAALGALSGPLHGGAPSRALEMLHAIGTPERAEAWVRDALDRGERIMGSATGSTGPKTPARRCCAKQRGSWEDPTSSWPSTSRRWCVGSCARPSPTAYSTSTSNTTPRSSSTRSAYPRPCSHRPSR